MSGADGIDPPGRSTVLGLRRSEWAIGATSVGLNILVNGILPERWHVAASLGATGVITGLAVRAGAGPREQGLHPEDLPQGTLYGLGAAMPIVAAMGAGVAFKKFRAFYREPRIVDATARKAGYEVLVRIPFGTALPEEVIFRGALLGMLSRYHPPLVATGISSVLFGLWHIAPTVDRIDARAAESGRPATGKASAVALSVAVTTCAGVLLAALRYRSKSIVAPWMAHSAANAGGFLAGWLAARVFRDGLGDGTDIGMAAGASATTAATN